MDHKRFYYPNAHRNCAEDSTETNCCPKHTLTHTNIIPIYCAQRHVYLFRINLIHSIFFPHPKWPINIRDVPAEDCLPKRRECWERLVIVFLYIYLQIWMDFARVVPSGCGKYSPNDKWTRKRSTRSINSGWCLFLGLCKGWRSQSAKRSLNA